MHRLIFFLKNEFRPLSLKGTPVSNSSSKLASLFELNLMYFVDIKRIESQYNNVKFIYESNPKEFITDGIISRTITIDKLSYPIKPEIFWAIEYEWNPDLFDDFFSNDFEKIIHITSHYKMAVFVTTDENCEERIGYALEVLNHASEYKNINKFYIIEVNRIEKPKKRKYNKLFINYYEYSSYNNVTSFHRIYHEHIF